MYLSAASLVALCMASVPSDDGGSSILLPTEFEEFDMVTGFCLLVIEKGDYGSVIVSGRQRLFMS